LPAATLRATAICNQLIVGRPHLSAAHVPDLYLYIKHKQEG